jgi:hypothetical protein
MSEWLKHNGGKRPVSPETLVIVKFRNGSTGKNAVAASHWGWVAQEDEDDIVEYKICDTGNHDSSLLARMADESAWSVRGQGEAPAEEYTGGSSSYYTVEVKNPTTPGNPQYTAECNDIIEALGMNYAEGNAFKALWRRAAARQGKRKKGYTDGLYDAEKIEFFGARLVAQEKAK